MSGSHTPTAFPSWWMLKMLVSAESGKLTSENEPHPPGVNVFYRYSRLNSPVQPLTDTQLSKRRVYW